MARRGRLSRQEMNNAAEKENSAFPLFPFPSARSVLDASKLLCCAVKPFRRVTLVKQARRPVM